MVAQSFEQDILLTQSIFRTFLSTDSNFSKPHFVPVPLPPIYGPPPPIKVGEESADEEEEEEEDFDEIDEEDILTKFENNLGKFKIDHFKNVYTMNPLTNVLEHWGMVNGTGHLIERNPTPPPAPVPVVLPPAPVPRPPSNVVQNQVPASTTDNNFAVQDTTDAVYAQDRNLFSAYVRCIKKSESKTVAQVIAICRTENIPVFTWTTSGRGGKTYYLKDTVKVDKVNIRITRTIFDQYVASTRSRLAKNVGKITTVWVKPAG